MATVLACAILLAGPGAVSGVAAGLEEEPICVGDSCQPLPPEPEDPSPGTLVPNPGNPPLHIFEPKKKKHLKLKTRKKHHKGHRRGGQGHGRHGAARRPMR